MPAERLLLTSIHDVGPRSETRVDLLRDHLGRHVPVDRLAMLVVPDHWGEAPLKAGTPFATRLRDWAEAGSEMFVHGWYHRDTSEHESFGLSALEAMSCGVPVIATSVGGTSEVVEHGVSGYLVDPHDVETMGRLAVDLLRDPSRHRAMGEAARRRVEERFAQDLVLWRYEKLYAELLGEPVPSRVGSA